MRSVKCDISLLIFICFSSLRVEITSQGLAPLGICSLQMLASTCACPPPPTHTLSLAGWWVGILQDLRGAGKEFPGETPLQD